MKSGVKKILLLFKQFSCAIFVLFVAGASFYSLKKIFNKSTQCRLFKCFPVDITCTNFYSLQMKRKVVSFVQSYLSNANYLSFDAANFYSTLGEHFDCVTKVTITKRLPMGFCIQIKGIDPAMRINKTSVLATNRGVYSNDDFTKFIGLERLPHITMPAIAPGMKITSTVYNDLKKLSAEYYKDYSCTYHNPSHIQLIPLNQSRYRSIITSNTALDKGLNKQLLDNIAEDSLRRGLCTKKAIDKKIQSIELDIRFEQRIIVKMIDHGKRGRGI